jgi:hypothetical protein
VLATRARATAGGPIDEAIEWIAPVGARCDERPAALARAVDEP